MKNLRYAWRNLWRNRRRTLITSASVLFAVFFALIFRSLQLGSYGHMFQNAIESYTGYMQIQQKDFWDEKVVDNTFHHDPDLVRRVEAEENVEATIPRFESFALASNGPQTKGVMVMGIDPEREQYLSKVSDRMVKYRLSPEVIQAMEKDEALPDALLRMARLFEHTSYTNASRLQLDMGISDRDASQYMPVLEAYAKFDNGSISMGDAGAWVGDRLARYLKLSIGDTLVLIGQGYHGTTAAGLYHIRGIVKLPLPDIDNKVVYLPLDLCQELYNAPGMLTSLALAVEKNDDKNLESTMNRLSTLLGEEHKLMEWKEMNEIMVSQMDADDKSGQIMIGILYLVIAFGVFGTVLMLTAERKREFGVLVAIGMQKKKLASVMTLEMLLIGLLGILGGSLLASLVISYGVNHPLIFKGEMAKMFEEYGMEPMMVFQKMGTYFLWQTVIVAFMVLIAIGYPLRKISKLEVVHALRA